MVSIGGDGLFRSDGGEERGIEDDFMMETGRQILEECMERFLQLREELDRKFLAKVMKAVCEHENAMRAERARKETEDHVVTPLAAASSVVTSALEVEEVVEVTAAVSLTAASTELAGTADSVSAAIVNGESDGGEECASHVSAHQIVNSARIEPPVGDSERGGPGRSNAPYAVTGGPLMVNFVAMSESVSLAFFMIHRGCC
jgi:hypothetical protein